MKIYTKTGDAGETALFAGPRVDKNHPRVEAYGSVDELGAVLGLVVSYDVPDDVGSLLTNIQHDLFVVGAELSSLERSPSMTVEAGQIESLEAAIDHFEASLPPLREFILPGGTSAAAAAHLARAVCRRAERRVVELARLAESNVSPQIIAYLNRLGDLLFVLARAINAAADRPDIVWQKPSRGDG